jgi:tetratricopeptide (TPR) repeat protein
MSTLDVHMPVVELEADGAEATLLHFFERESGKWLLPKEGRFWDAVKASHAAGNAGREKTIAIIDAGFDLSIPHLAERTRTILIQNQSPKKPTAHGTLVALLILEVAPEAQLELYEVTGSAGVDSQLLLTAFDLVRTSSASVLNVSLGHAQHFSVDELISLQAGVGLSEAELKVSLEEGRQRTDHECKLCAAADAVAKAGKIVVAAAGNDPGAIYCPARSSHVIASGFSVEQLNIASDGGELAMSAITNDFSHSQFTDYTIRQVPGALGTSYSAPLLSGFLALDTDWDEFYAFVIAQRKAANASWFYRLARETNDKNALNTAIDLFDQSLELLPHRHERDDSSVPCGECILFAEDIYVNYGLASASKGDFERSALLWEAAAKFAPDSPHAYANLGWLNFLAVKNILSEDFPANAYRALMLLDKSANLYRRAIEIRPLFDGYINQYKAIVDVERHLRIDIIQRLRLLQLLKVYFASQHTPAQVDQAMEILRTLDPKALFAKERKKVCAFLEELAVFSDDLGKKVRKKFDVEAFLNFWKNR